MYGMIHKAARELAVAMVGEAAWGEVIQSCGLGSEHFISGQHYSDDLTVRLIGAIAAKAGVAVDSLLKDFGRHWIKFADRSNYAAVLDLAGDDLETFIKNLDRMHASIKATMPEAAMPSFELVKAAGNRITVVYRSPRRGLEPFVAGLFEGLLERFGETGTVALKPSGDDFIFDIRHERVSRVA
jgi:hypothetical protein